MTSVKIEYVGGGHDHLKLTDAQAGELVTAMAARNPAHLIVNEDESYTVINAQNIVRVDYRMGADVGSDTPEDTRTVAELKADLDAAGVEYEKGAHKADLLELARARGV